MIRAATETEFPELQQGSDWFAVMEEDGLVTGHIACSSISGLPFIHELNYWGSDPYSTAKLCIAARKKLREWGFEEAFCNISAEQPSMLEPLTNHGFKVVQIILRSELNMNLKGES